MPPKQTQPFEMNRFTKGLITEASRLQFPPDASYDERNFELDRTGKRSRRRGIGFEQAYVTNNTSYTRSEDGNLAANTFVWESVGEDPSLQFMVVQVGAYVYFHDYSQITLSTAPVGSIQVGTAKVRDFSFAAIDGDLIIADGRSELTRVEYVDGTFNTSVYRLKVRDLWGLEDILNGRDLNSPQWLNWRPPSTTDAHTYNVRNQGWGIPRLVKEEGEVKRDALAFSVSQFNHNLYPSNSDVMEEWIRPDPDAKEQRLKFFSRDYQGNPPFNVPAAKGYFIIDLLNRGTSRYTEYKNNMTKHPDLTIDIAQTFNEDRTPGGARVIAQYAGRIFYGGFQGTVVEGDERSPRLSSYIAYSQLVDSPDQLGRCYQAGDPTSVDESDLVATDGGVIRISGAQEIVALKSIGRSLFVIADNGIWRVSGGTDQGFSADNFEVEKITEHGVAAKDSLVEVDNSLLYWAENGIYRLSPGQLGTWTAENITANTIQSFYDAILPSDKTNCKAVFDNFARKVRWLYTNGSDNASLPLSKELQLDVDLAAFVPLEFYNTGAQTSPYAVNYALAQPFTRVTEVQNVDASANQVQVGGVSVSLGEEVTTFAEEVPVVKYLTFWSDGLSTSTIKYSFAELNRTDWLDWGVTDAAGYLETGSFIGGDSSRDKEVPYLTFHMEKGFTGEVQDLPSECGVYSCDSFLASAYAAGMPTVSFWEANQTNPTVPAGFSFDDDVSSPQWVTTQPARVGDILQSGGGGNIDQYNLWEVGNTIDACGDQVYSLGLGENTFALPQGPKLFVEDTLEDEETLYLIVAGGVSDSSNGDSLWFRQKRFQVGYPWNPAANTDRTDNFGVRYDDFQGFGLIRSFGSPPFFGFVNWESINFFAMTIGFGNERIVEGSEVGFSAGTWGWVGDYSLTLQVNDTIWTYDETYQLSLFDSKGQTITLTATWQPTSYMFSGMTTDLFALTQRVNDVTTSDAYNWYKKNFIGYQQPGTCPEPGTIPGAITDSSCLVTTKWEHTTQGNTGRWAGPFQVYREVRHQDEDGFDVVTTRNRVKGRGHAYRMRMATEPAKACNILGWNLALTGNSYV